MPFYNSPSLFTGGIAMSSRELLAKLLCQLVRVAFWYCIACTWASRDPHNWEEKCIEPRFPGPQYQSISANPVRPVQTVILLITSWSSIRKGSRAEMLMIPMMWEYVVMCVETSVWSASLNSKFPRRRMATRRLKIDVMCFGLKPRVPMVARNSSIAMESSPNIPAWRR